MQIQDTPVDDVKVIRNMHYEDDRGFFMETWSAGGLSRLGLDAGFVQDNWSRSVKGVLRGLHYQIRHTQGKLVRCISGEVFDVVVDLRRSSKTFGKWFGLHLSDSNHLGLWVPPGFAHGFLALSDRVDFVYKCTDIYAPGGEVTIRWDDPKIGIEWPLAEGQEPIIGEKDRVDCVEFDDAPLFP